MSEQIILLCFLNFQSDLFCRSRTTWETTNERTCHMTTKSNHLRVWFPLFDVQSTHRVFFWGGKFRGLFHGFDKKAKRVKRAKEGWEGNIRTCLLPSLCSPLSFILLSYLWSWGSLLFRRWFLYGLRGYFLRFEGLRPFISLTDFSFIFSRFTWTL